MLFQTPQHLLEVLSRVQSGILRILHNLVNTFLVRFSLFHLQEVIDPDMINYIKKSLALSTVITGEMATDDRQRLESLKDR